MSDKNLNMELDPKKVLQALTDMGDEFKNLGKIVDQALGKDAVSSLKEMETAAEKGSNNIAGYFRNLGKRVKEDLKTAFDIGGLLGGLKIAKELGEGIKSVFDLEKAFDRLNTRLQLTGKTFENFKKQVGEKVAATGQKLEDVFPGVETAAAKGGVKGPKDLASIGEQLAKVRAATGEGTEALADSVVEILKTQGKKVNADTFRQTLDTLQATRVQGAFKTAGEAGGAIQQLSPYAQKLGLNTRQLGGLASQASKGGAAGQDILRQLMEQATQVGGPERLNAVFGAELFKGGKLDPSAFGKINKNKYGQYSQQVLESATGLTGASGADLSRFLDSMKTGMADYKKVVNGSNETASQFKGASSNLATSFDKFKEKTKNAGREVGESLSSAANQLLQGNYKGAMERLKDAGKNAYENKGTIGAALGLSGLAGLMIGKGAGGIMSKLPGIGGLAGGLAGAEAAKAAGVQPVYVVNASDIGGGGGLLGKAAGAAGALAKFGGMAAKGGGAIGALGLGYEAGNMLNQIPAVQKAGSGITDMLFKAFNPSDDELMKQGASQVKKAGAGTSDAKGAGGLHPEIIAASVAKGVETGMTKVNKNKTTQFSNPSRPTGSGSSM